MVGKSLVLVAEDETPKKFNEEKLRQLKPAFGKEGTITAGNASSINDGAASVIVLSAARAEGLPLHHRPKSSATPLHRASRSGSRRRPSAPSRDCSIACR